MPDQDPIRRSLLRAAHLVLCAAERARPAAGEAAEVGNGRWRVRVELLPHQQETAGRRQEAPAPHLTGLDRHILACAPVQPVTMARLGRLCEHDPDSYFQGRVRRLVGHGLLVHDFRGFCLAAQS